MISYKEYKKVNTFIEQLGKEEPLPEKKLKNSVDKTRAYRLKAISNLNDIKAQNRLNRLAVQSELMY